MEDLTIFEPETNSVTELLYADGGVHAGFPSPAQDYVDRRIDLNRDLILHPESTFYARVSGDSMIDAGVFDGDILVVDRSLTPGKRSMAVCVLNGEFTLKYVERRPGGVVLVPANSAYKPINVEEGDDFQVWGVVTYVIHRVNNGL